MYPVNNYLIVAECSPEKTSSTMLELPPVETEVKQFEVVASPLHDLKGYLVYALKKDVVELPDGQFAVKYEQLIATGVNHA